MDFGIIVNLIQQTIDKIYLFKDRQIKSNDRILNELLDPLFADLQKVVEHYFEIFHRAKQTILSDPGNLKKEVEELAKFSRENIAARIKVRELVQVLSEVYPNKQLQLFAKKTDDFFIVL